MQKLCCLLLLFCNNLIAQPIQLSSGTYHLKTKAAEKFKIRSADVFMEKAHLLIQFNQLPSQEEKEKFEKSGIEFLHYIPQNAYLIAVNKSFRFKTDKTIKHITGVHTAWKLHESLAKKAYPPHAVIKRKEIQLILTFYSDVSYVPAQQHLEKMKVLILNTNKDNHQINVQIPITQIQKISALPYVQFMEPVSPEPVPDNYTGGTLNKINFLYNDWSTGASYNGNGIQVMLQDDGIIGPHIDFQGRALQYITNNTGDHGDHVGGTIAGAGNLNPLYRGMAWGATLHVYDANDNNYNKIPTIYNNDKIVITSKSYAQTCNGGYTAICNQLDKQLRDYPALQHFFSAGNTGANDCGYGAGATWGNITGGHKSAKNTIAVGNTNSDGVLASSSSRGPATDGRIKPDICAKGTDVMSTTIPSFAPSQYILKTGTSMSCPMASGTMAVLYEVFQKNNAGAMPYNALMKGIMMNTADDYGNPGPDFRYGFGIVNAKRALKVIKNKSYLIDSITQNVTKNHIISVPAGTLRVKVMVYWNDKEAASGAKPALVNDLNCTLTDQGNTYLPLRLDPKPTAASLNRPAFQGIDSLNNVEQMIIDNPSAVCTLSVNGFAVPFGPQKYCVIYDFIEEGIQLTYPSGREKMTPSGQELIRWESIDTTNKITLSYSTNNGSTWTVLSTNINAKTRSYTWSPPNILTNQLLFKVEQDIYVDSNKVPSTIMNIPVNLTLFKNCGDSLILRWSAAANAKGYIVYALGEKYMDSIAYVTKNEYIKLCNNPYDVTYYAVASVHNNDFVGRRCVAIPKLSPTANCSSVAPDLTISRLISPGASISRNCQGKLDLNVIAKVANLSNVSVSSFKVYYKIDTFSPVQLSSGSLLGKDSITISFPKNILDISTGIKHLKVWVESVADIIKCNDTIDYPITITKEELNTLIREDFESFKICSSVSNCAGTSCPLSKGWNNETNGAGDDIDWRVYAGSTPSNSSGTGPTVDANPGTSTGQYLYLEATSCVNKVAHLISPCINLDSMTNPSLTFKYHMYGFNINDLHVDLYNGSTWILDITPAITGNKGNQWLTQNVDLSSYSGIINLRFRGRTGNGNAGDMAIDDISIYSKSTVKADFNTNDPYCANKTIRFTNFSVNSNQHIWNFGNDASPSTSIAQEYVDVTFATPGEKTIRLIASNPSFADTSVFKVMIEDIPVPNFTYTSVGFDYSFNNTTLYGSGYNWNFGDGNLSTVTNPVNRFSQNGDYNVVLTAAGNCGTDSITKKVSVAVNANSIDHLNKGGKISVDPNPAHDFIYVRTLEPLKGKWTYSITGLDGKTFVPDNQYSSDKINIQSLPAGVYLFSLTQGKQNHVFKLIKE